VVVIYSVFIRIKTIHFTGLVKYNFFIPYRYIFSQQLLLKNILLITLFPSVEKLELYFVVCISLDIVDNDNDSG